MLVLTPLPTGMLRASKKPLALNIRGGQLTPNPQLPRAPASFLLRRKGFQLTPRPILNLIQPVLTKLMKYLNDKTILSWKPSDPQSSRLI